MKIISHRGNLKGPDPLRENIPEAIEEALSLGYDVEIDVWYMGNSFWLGHDRNERKFNTMQLFDWCKLGDIYLHCKNHRALQMFLKDNANLLPNVYPFYHDVDNCILMRDDIIWVHPKAVKSFENIPDNCIAVLPNCKNVVSISDDLNLSKFLGICTDYPENVRNSI